ncbi:MAG: glutathione S-transferase [Rhodanobacter sp. 68-29]|uniref:glutathione S-transferase family protein n=1 Tax=Rhodanobacter sp. PCA2 TaxID=2006117 RepID=UPI00086CB9FE|nr:glutathione S-transferase family protein [Rhodanobacter sp. PCA2]MBA2077489.1 glutathione S-transferase [Rhodanobacter sp. PCA2]MBN8923441.1 glutathione S-transferase family protein [Rhodanobacter sp.]ODU73921.1 MAG: glutathione S-transferase [Rhodanobacter sp. SCN 69-32]OJY55306.1 MAG: glutathione S-transferase [Rhodanobacter sp. 68-29]
MNLQLYMHPLSSFCHKALIALYENDTPFEPRMVRLDDEASREAFRKVWPILRFPVLRDEARGRIVPESSIIIEYLALHYPGRTALLPADPQAALEVRERDRFFDLYLHVPTQKVITDRMRPADGHDEIGVAQARAQLRTAYALLEREMGGRTWATGDDFTMADCAAAPPLFYSAWAEPLDDFPHVAAYRQRLMERPSFARALREAEPYLHLVPKAPA